MKIFVFVLISQEIRATAAKSKQIQIGAKIRILEQFCEKSKPIFNQFFAKTSNPDIAHFSE